MLDRFGRGDDVAEPNRNIHNVYRSNLYKRTKWLEEFRKNKAKHFSLFSFFYKMRHKQVRFNNYPLLSEINRNRAVTVEELAQKLYSSHSTLYRSL